MKAILEFNLDEYEDRLKHRRCIGATNAYIALHEIDKELRSIIKYDKHILPGSKYSTPDGLKEITERESCILNEFANLLRTKIAQIVQDNNIDLNDLD